MIKFRELSESDLPMLHRWLNQPHMRRFYQHQHISLESVKTKYRPRIEGAVPAHAHIALIDDQPVGKIQCYRVKDYPDFADEIGEKNGISVDLFIGDPANLGKGIGKSMLREYLKTIAFPMFPEEHSCFICHEVDNDAALATSKACGFRFVRNIMEDGVKCELLRLEASC